jgi:hypothetical protein
MRHALAAQLSARVRWLHLTLFIGPFAEVFPT